mmetsp:Transcript_50378/g.150616  ORF Transcript_50378/g.150616 Transcript_50378/m.150616 type:complete len:221 (-) Transcript_50378:272-934(-)
MAAKLISRPRDGKDTCRNLLAAHQLNLSSKMLEDPGLPVTSSKLLRSHLMKALVAWKWTNATMPQTVTTKARPYDITAATRTGSPNGSSSNWTAVGSATPKPTPLTCAEAAVGWLANFVMKPESTPTRLCERPVATPFASRAACRGAALRGWPLTARNTIAVLSTSMYAMAFIRDVHCLGRECTAIKGLRSAMANSTNMVQPEPTNCARPMRIRTSVPNS